MFILPVVGFIVILLIVLIIFIMNTKVSAKDFFLHLGAMVGLYASAIALGNLLFNAINEAFPTIDRYYYGTPRLSFAVATLIIVFPIFIFLSYLLEREYKKEPEKEESWVRRWSAYITLFISGVILAGDLVAVLYKFLDGQDLTAAFLLKALSVLLIAVMVFGYYIQDIRGKMSGRGKKFWAVTAAVIILASIVLGFSVIGSPRTQRLMRYDDQKVSDLQSVQWQIVNIWQRTGSLPETLTNDPISSYKMPLDSQTGEAYEYRKTGNLSFELCAEFNRESRAESVRTPVSIEMGKIGSENWEHGAGRQCFERVIDPTLYPTQIRG